MGKKIPPFITQLQAEGTRADRLLIREETHLEAQKLANKMPTYPPDRMMYIKGLAQKALRKELDLEVFQLFIKMTNSWMELEACMPRVKMLERRRNA